MKDWFERLEKGESITFPKINFIPIIWQNRLDRDYEKGSSLDFKVDGKWLTVKANKLIKKDFINELNK